MDGFSRYVEGGDGINEPQGTSPDSRQRRADRNSIDHTPTWSNFREETIERADGSSATVNIGLPIGEVGRTLYGLTNGWPQCVSGSLFVQGPEHRPRFLETPAALFAWIGGKLTGGSRNRIRWARGQDKVSKEELFQHLVQTATAHDAVESFPHWPGLPKHYYMHPPMQGVDGRSLRGLLQRFRPSTPCDFDLIKALFLTALWGGPPGQRPAFLIESEKEDPRGGRGVGKTKLGQAVAYLIGGHIDARPCEDFDKLMTRLLSPAALDRRIVLLDNVKVLRFSWSDLEALITGDIISGRRLYAGEGRRPNTLLWVITLNNASLSRDMAQRCVIVHVKRPHRDPKWEAETWSFIDRRRWSIIGDILAELQAPVRALRQYSRWSAWEDAVLTHVADPVECQRVIEERQAAADDDSAEAALVRQEFVNELRRRGHTADATYAFFTSPVAGAVVNAATGEKKSVPWACRYLSTLTISELRNSAKDGVNGWYWTGKNSDQTASPVEFDQ